MPRAAKAAARGAFLARAEPPAIENTIGGLPSGRRALLGIFEDQPGVTGHEIRKDMTFQMELAERKGFEPLIRL